MTEEQVKEATGERLRAWRVAAGLSQARLAAMLGVTQQAVSLWESGSRPDLMSAIRLEDLTGIAVRAWAREAA